MLILRNKNSLLFWISCSRERVYLQVEKGYIVLVPVPVKQEQTEATSKKIQGVIVDTNGDPVIGASIQEKGVVGKGTVSDLDGKFNLSVASNAVLLISYIGFQSLEVKVGNRTSLSLVLKEDHQLLDEVVVIGYGTMEKRAVTSSITSISSKDLVTGLGGFYHCDCSERKNLRYECFRDLQSECLC